MRVFLSAGEASGDAYGAAIVRALKERVSDLQLQGMGSHAMRTEGVELVADASRHSAIGILRSIGVGPQVVQAYRRVRKALGVGRPGVFIAIDYGFVNIRHSRHAKRLGWKVLYFIPPGSWRKDRQGADLPSITDAIVTPFPWSAEILNKMGANAHWFGHPIKSLSSRATMGGGKGIAVLPGSRNQEVQHNLPAIAQAVRGMAPVEFAVASTIGAARMRSSWMQLAPDRSEDVFTENDVSGVLGRARAAIVCSGTATLQAAVLHCPMVVIYGYSKLMSMEVKLLGLEKKVKYVSLPNIYLDRPAVPEVLGTAVTGEAIRGWIERLLADSDERRQQLAAFEELDELLGPYDCIERTADLIVQLGLGV